MTDLVHRFAPVADRLRADPSAVNLSSDTQTRPTPAMFEAMVTAPIGDEQCGADPTTLALEERVAGLLGHEAAVFLPSGTMCNEVAVRLHVGHTGDEVLAEAGCHILNFEAGGVAALSGAVVTPVHGERGVFTAEQVEAAARTPDDRYAPATRLVCLEQTANAGGGTVWPLATMRDVVAAARRRGLAYHLDGARLLNAAVASGEPPAAYASTFDTAWIDLSKGLGAPVGAVLVGSAELIDRAWRYKQMWGGALRQSGVLAAAGRYALDHHVDRLADDHVNARRLAEGLADIDGVELDPACVETNIVYFAVPDAEQFVADLAKHRVAMGATGAGQVRAVTHLDVDAAGIETALHAVRDVLG